MTSRTVCGPIMYLICILQKCLRLQSGVFIEIRFLPSKINLLQLILCNMCVMIRYSWFAVVISTVISILAVKRINNCHFSPNCNKLFSLFKKIGKNVWRGDMSVRFGRGVGIDMKFSKLAVRKVGGPTFYLICIFENGCHFTKVLL